MVSRVSLKMNRSVGIMVSKNLWDEAESRKVVSKYVDAGYGEDIALRTYSARLLGRDPALVLHGGGNALC